MCSSCLNYRWPSSCNTAVKCKQTSSTSWQTGGSGERDGVGGGERDGVGGRERGWEEREIWDGRERERWGGG